MKKRQPGWILGIVLGGVTVVSAQAIRVSIDVKPGDAKTTIEPDRGGMVPVAILTTAQFDASSTGGPPSTDVK